MKTIATSALFASAFATSLGFSGMAAAEAAHDAPIVAHYDDGHGHNGTDLDNDDPVTDQGPNLGTEPLGDTEQLADAGQGEKGAGQGEKKAAVEAKKAADDADDADDESDATDEEDGTDETPGRPGGNTHLPRNGITHDNPDSGQADDDDEEEDAPVAKTADQAPVRPGGKTHFPRNGMEHDNSDHPVTGQGPNKGTGALNDTLDSAGGKHHR